MNVTGVLMNAVLMHSAWTQWEATTAHATLDMMEMALIAQVSFLHISSNKFSVTLLLIFPDIDECTIDTHNCDENANCADTDGSFQCTCQSGYEGNGTVCQSAMMTLPVCSA